MGSTPTAPSWGTSRNTDGTRGRLLRPVKGREPLLEPFQLGQVVVDDVRAGAVVGQVVLVIRFRRVETLERHYLRRDRAGVGRVVLQSRDHGARRSQLLGRAVEHDGAVLGALVRPLAIALGGVV